MQKTVLLITLLLSAPFIQAQKDALTNPSDILDAFHRVELSMNKTGNTIDEKNKATLERLYEKISKTPTLLPYLNKATLVDETATEFVTYVEDLKQQIIKQSGGANDDIENHVDLLIKQAKGKELRDKINKARVTMLAYLTPEQQTLIKSDLLIEYNAYRFQSWESEMFEHSPAAAVVTILEKIKNDAKNTEAQVLQVIVKSIDGDCKKVSAIVIPKSAFVMAGGKFEADILLASYDTCTSYDIIINGQRIKTNSGIAKYEMVTSGNREHKLNGYIDYRSEHIPFETNYSTYWASASITADAMNMLYIGLDNPVSVSVPGFLPEKVVVSMSGGTISYKGGSSYIAKVSTRGEATINVSVKMDDDSVRPMGSAKFRVRKVPVPFAQLGAISNGNTENKDIIVANATKLYSGCGEGFAFEGLKYTVLKFNISLSGSKNQTIQIEGDKLTDVAKEMVENAKSGDKIIIDDVIVSGPDGERKASPFVITVK